MIRMRKLMYILTGFLHYNRSDIFKTLSVINLHVRWQFFIEQGTRLISFSGYCPGGFQKWSHKQKVGSTESLLQAEETLLQAYSVSKTPNFKLSNSKTLSLLRRGGTAFFVLSIIKL